MNDYEKLGLKEGASKEAIQTAYKVKMLRYQQLGENRTAEEEAEFEEVDKAYNRLCGYDVPLEEIPHGKIKDFFYYNKEKFIVIALAMVILIVIIVQSFNRPSYDFSVAIIGDFKTKSDQISVDVESSISQMMKEQILDVKDPLITTYPRGGTIVQDSTYMAMQQKLMIELDFGETGIDLMLLDTENYEDFLQREYLYALDEYITVYEQGNEAIPEALLVKNSEGKVYGIRLSGNEYIEACNFTYTGDFIACIFKNSRRKELAFSGIQALSLQFKPLPVAEKPSEDPEKEASENPDAKPTQDSTPKPTGEPTKEPLEQPTQAPTKEPTRKSTVESAEKSAA